METYDWISFWALIREDADGLVARLAAHDAIALAGGFVATFVAEPIAVGDVVHRRAEAVRVVALVARTAAAGPSCRRCGKTGS